MALKERYSNTTSLWTPSQTGIYPLSTNLVFQLDADFEDNFTTGSNDYLTSAVDNVGSIEFGVLDPSDYRTFPRYAVEGAGSSYIGNRRTMWFWEDAVRYGPNTTLTSSATTNWSTKNFPVGNEDRAVFFVLRVNSLRAFTNPNPNNVWEYGVETANSAYGFGLVETGSNENLPPSGDFRTSNPGNAVLLNGLSGVTFQSGSDLILNSPTGAFGPQPDIWYMFHSSSSTGSIQKNGQPDKYTYNSTLATLTSSFGLNDPYFYIGDEVGSAFAGDYTIGEILILDGIPSNDDQQRIEGYLAWKWDLTGSLPTSHPYKTVQPLNRLPFPVFGTPPAVIINPQGAPEGPTVDKFEAANVTYGKTGSVEQVPFTLQQPGPFSIKRRETAYQVTRGDSNE